MQTLATDNLQSFYREHVSAPSLVMMGLAAVLSFVVWGYRRNPASTQSLKLPPGVPALPVVGSIPFLGLTGVDDHLRYQKLAEKYGSIYSFWLSNKFVVVLSGYDVIRTALVDQAIVMAGRAWASSYFVKFCNPSVLGIVMPSYTPIYKRDRQVSLAIMKDLGVGRNVMESKIQEEVDSLVQHIRGLDGRPYDIRQSLHISVSNVICSILMGKRFPIDDCPELKEMIHAIERMFGLTAKAALVDFFPKLAYLPSFKKCAQDLIDTLALIDKFIKQFVSEHEEKHYAGKDVDFIDQYIDRTGDDYCTENLMFIARDLFMAGTDTTATTLQWALIYMVNNPDVQRKVQEELDREVGRGRLPSLRDKSRLPYTEAVIQEFQRLATLVPAGVPHTTLSDTELCGYHIPKDAQVFINLWSVLRDPELWPEPDTFRPERFLDDNGKAVHRSELIPFSLGRRSCLGELMARQELFLYFCGMIQNFTITAAGDVTRLDEEGRASLSRVPLPFEIVATPRV